MGVRGDGRGGLCVNKELYIPNSECGGDSVRSTLEVLNWIQEEEEINPGKVLK